MSILDPNKIKMAYSRLLPLCNSLDQHLLDFICTHPGLTVTDILTHREIIPVISEQCVLSQKLTILRSIGVVTYERDGKYVRYYPDEEALTKLKQTLHQFHLDTPDVDYPDDQLLQSLSA